MRESSLDSEPARPARSANDVFQVTPRSTMNPFRHGAVGDPNAGPTPPLTHQLMILPLTTDEFLAHTSPRKSPVLVHSAFFQSDIMMGRTKLGDGKSLLRITTIIEPQLTNNSYLTSMSLWNPQPYSLSMHQYFDCF